LSIFKSNKKQNFNNKSQGVKSIIKGFNESNRTEESQVLKYIYGAFARLSASVFRLMQTFGPFKLRLSNTSESRVK